MALLACNKEPGTQVEVVPSGDIVFKNYQLSTVKTRLIGKWRLIYGEGGFAGQAVYCSNCTVEITKSDSMYWVEMGMPKIASPILWLYAKTFNDTLVYQMSIHYITGNPRTYILDRIYKDSLIFYEYGRDGYRFFLTK